MAIATNLIHFYSQTRIQKPTELQLKDRKMSGLADEYRKEAVRCHKNAESSLKEADRAFWLLLAANWLKLAEDRDKIANSNLRDGDLLMSRPLRSSL